MNVLSLLLLLSISFSLCFGQQKTQSAGASPRSSLGAKLTRINDFVIAKHKYHNFSGNVLVAEKGRVIYTKSIGFADIKRAQPLTNASVFNIGSISKEFTAAAVMLCVERGLLKLDDQLAKYLPEVPYEGISIKHLLTHTSGLPEQNELMYKYWNSDEPVTNRDMLDHLIRYKPEITFKPGESFKYCNTNYSLLALVVEKVSGQRFQDFVTKNIFAPLDLKQTRFLNPQRGNYKTIPNQTENYIFDQDKKQFLPPAEIPQWKKAVPLSGLVGAGNIHSTIFDLFKWQESLKTSKILKRESIAEMQSPHVKANVDGSDAYGYGFEIQSIYSDKKIFHYGSTLGYWNSLQHFQNADRTIVVLSNNEGEKGLTNAIAAILFDAEVSLPSEHKETKLPVELLKRFEGTYEAADGRKFSIENRNGKLYRVVPNAEPRELKAESSTKLFYDDGSDRQIEFVFDQSEVKRVTFISQGLRIELGKVK